MVAEAAAELAAVTAEAAGAAGVLAGADFAFAAHDMLVREAEYCNQGEKCGKKQNIAISNNTDIASHPLVQNSILQLS